MKDFICTNCNAVFKSNQGLQYHINKKTCEKFDYDYECKHCGKGFTTDSSMYRHMKYSCKVKKQEEQAKNEIFERLLELEEKNKMIEEKNRIIEEKSTKRLQKLENENKKLKEEVKKLVKNQNASKTKIVADKVNVNNGNINNGTVNNITLVAYGTEDLSKLDKAELLKIFKQGYNSTLKMTEVVHFNPKHPEFHNVYITNMKDKYAMMYDGTNWTLTIKDDLITRIYDDKKTYIEENLEEFIESLAPSQKRALDRWVETDEEDEKIKMVKERIKLLLYNSRNIPIDTQKNISECKKVKMIESSEKNVPVKVSKTSDIKKVVKSKVSVTKGRTKTVNG